MRQILLLINLTIVCHLTYSQTNVFHPISNSGIWRVDGKYINNVEGCDVNYYFTYYINGDTIIGANSYKKVYKTPVFADSSGATFPDMPCDANLASKLIAGYSAALRDDSIAFKTFIIRKSENFERLLFDYNLVAGDPVDGEMGPNPGFVVSLVDSVLIDGNYRKRWNFDDQSMFSYYIAGIGSRSGFIEPANQSGNSSTNRLICVRDTNNVAYDGEFSSNFGCVNIASTNEIDLKKNYQIFPNPFSNQTTLQFESSIVDGQLFIYDLKGSKMMELTNVNGTEIQIQRDKLQDGMYILNLIENQKLIVNEKLIIAK
jgi:hypothetical protein